MDHRFIPPRWLEDLINFLVAVAIVAAIAGVCYLISNIPADDFLKHTK